MEPMAPACSAIAGHTPSVSKICREPLPSAVVRSSKLGCADESGDTLSMSSTRNGVSRSASAKLAPTMPPPTMTTSYVFTGERSCHRRHEALDGDGILRHAVGQHLAAVTCDDDVVLDADADAMEFLGRAGRP